MVDRAHHELIGVAARFLIALKLHKFNESSLFADMLGAAVFTIRDTLVRSALVSLVSLYDNRPNSLNLLEAINSILLPKELSKLVASEFVCSQASTLEIQERRLRALQRRFSQGDLKTSLKDITYVRNKGIGHFDTTITAGTSRGSTRDVAKVLIASSQIVRGVRLLSSGRILDTTTIWRNARKQANATFDAIRAGDAILTTKEQNFS